jgi:hypothetical protein
MCRAAGSSCTIFIFYKNVKNILLVCRCITTYLLSRGSMLHGNKNILFLGSIYVINKNNKKILIINKNNKNNKFNE